MEKHGPIAAARKAEAELVALGRLVGFVGSRQDGIRWGMLF
jgi:hypothetical protein